MADEAPESKPKRTIAFVVVAFLLVFAQAWIAPAWISTVGAALRELAVLVLAFGVLEKWWDDEFTWAGALRVMALGLALFAIGNMIDVFSTSRGRSHGAHDVVDAAAE